MLSKYFFELKNRFLLIIFSWFIAVITCYGYKETLLFLLIKVNYILYDSSVFYFIATNLTDVFAVYLKLSYFVSNQLILVFLIYHFLIFLSPALYTHEYKRIKSTIIFWFFVMISCVLIFHFYVLPFAWYFFLNYQSVNIFFEARINEYFSFYVTVYFGLMVIGHFFIAIFLILDFITNKVVFVKNYRKSCYFLFFVLGALITPPDVISQILFGFSCVLIYESIIVTIILKVFVTGSSSATS